MKWKCVPIAVVGVAICVAQAADAGQLEDGTTANDRGDYPAAVALWRPLAVQGVAQAQFFLGTMHENGKGVAQDYAEAMKWYRLAAENKGYEAPMYALGSMYRNGRGVPQDYAHAYMWYEIAASSGGFVATRLRDGLATKMSLEQIAHAQEMAKRCEQSMRRDCD